MAFNASIDAVLLHQKLMENCPSFRSGLPCCELISVWPTCQCHSPSFPSSAYGPQLSGTHQGSLSRAPPLTDLWARAVIPISLLLFSLRLRRSPPSASAAGEENPLHLHLPPRGPRAPEGLAEAGSHGRRRACRRQKVV